MPDNGGGVRVSVIYMHVIGMLGAITLVSITGGVVMSCLGHDVPSWLMIPMGAATGGIPAVLALVNRPVRRRNESEGS